MIFTALYDSTHLQVFQVLAGRSECGDATEVAHVDAAGVHGRLERLSVSGDQGELDTLPHHARDHHIREECRRLSQQLAISLQHLL